MIEFLIKGLLRDRSRSKLPVIVVATGVMLTVFLHAYITGFMGDAIEINARFTTGHLKVMTRAYSENPGVMPNDLALLDVDELKSLLNDCFPEIKWYDRIHFGGLIDVSDEQGNTRTQGMAFGMGVNLFSAGSSEIERLNLINSLVMGNIPQLPGEVLISDAFAQKLQIQPGNAITLIGSTMNGALTMQNFTVSGTVFFGIEIMDKGAIIADIEDIRIALDMPNAAGEIVGYFRAGFYEHPLALNMSKSFNSKYGDKEDDFAPVMKSLSQQGGMGTYVMLVRFWSFYITSVFVLAMSLVLWNAGLLGGLRRYGEVGIRLAMGEEKGHVYRTLIYESILIGIAGSIMGTMMGLLFAWLLQTYGINISGMMEGASIMTPTVIRARITSMDYYIGFIPGLASNLIGTILSGIGIYRRQTAKLFKELES